ncbi:MAG: colanic acid biosynthesis acetyltransferase WcaF [Opitutaceae bacterium]
MSSEAPYLGQDCATPYPALEVAARELWAACQHTLFRWSPRSCHGFRARLLRLFGADVPEPGRVVVFPTVRIVFPWKLRLSPRSMLGPRVRVHNLARIEIGYGANVSQDCHLCAGTHDYSKWSMPLIARPIAIGANAWLGAEVFVGPGVSVGELSVVGARSVVVRDLPARHLCVGHPCRPIRPRADPAP